MVEEDPNGVKFAPKLTPKMIAHQSTIELDPKLLVITSTIGINAAVNGISTITDEASPTIQRTKIITNNKLLEANWINGSENVCKIPPSLNPLTNMSNEETKKITLQSIL